MGPSRKQSLLVGRVLLLPKDISCFLGIVLDLLRMDIGGDYWNAVTNSRWYLVSSWIGISGRTRELSVG